MVVCAAAYQKSDDNDGEEKPEHAIDGSQPILVVENLVVDYPTSNGCKRILDGVCTVVDTGSAMVNRKAARLCGRKASQLKAIVVDRFFETKREAIAWTNAHSEFMTLQIVPPGSRRDLSEP